MAKRKILIITSIIFALLFLATGTYFFYSQKFKKPITKEEIKPEEKPKEEKPEEIECIIFDKEFCQKGEPLYDKEGKFVGLGFNLPDKTKIYSPFDGTIDNGGYYDVFENQGHQGIFIQKQEGNKIITFAALGKVKAVIKPQRPVFPENPDLLVQEPVEKGKFVAQVDDTLPYIIITPEEDPSKQKTYNVFVGFWELDGQKGGGISKELYKEFFKNVNF